MRCFYGIKNSLYLFYIGIVLFCSVFQLRAQDNTVFNSLLEKLNTYTTTDVPEKVYLQTDKDYYTNGDTLWFKTYILDGISHTVSEKSRVVHVELTDSEQEVIERRKIYTGFEGGSGDIALAENIEKGTYYLRAYTKYMLNEKEPVLFQKEIPIWTYTINSKKNAEKTSKNKRATEGRKDDILEKVTPKTNVQFFPEGGNLVTGLANVLGLKITDVKGEGISLTGKITNENGSLVSMFSTAEFGLGRVQFKVEPNTDYFTEIEIDSKVEKYEISKPLPKGYVLQVSNRGEYLQIRVSTTITNGLNGSVLFGHVRGVPELNYVAKNRTENSYEVKLSTAELNDGVATFTLFTSDGEPVCERLVFIENPNNPVELEVKTNAPSYSLRQKITIDLSVLDELGLPLNGNFAMSVVSQNAIKNSSENIKSWLLLNSDLGGTVENPNYFFENDSKSRKNLLDILMMTHGWRRFVWKELQTNGTPATLKFLPEKGLEINGYTVELDNRQEPLMSSVDLTILPPNIYKEETSTNLQGKFSFGPMIFRDSVSAIITASTADESKNIAIYLEPTFPKFLIKDSLRLQKKKYINKIEPSYKEEVSKRKNKDFKYDPKVIQLDEAIGKGKFKTKKQLINEALNERTMYGQALNRIIPDSILDSDFMSVMDLIERNVSGVRIFGQYPNQRIELRPHFGGNAIIDKSGLSSEHPKDPLYLLDGIPVSSGFAQNMFGGEVLFIDVLKSAGEIAQYGVRGANGVIAMYTDRGENYEFVEEKKTNIANYTLSGFYSAREFYSPNYSMAKTNVEKPDFRTTLYWVPDINLSDIEPTQFKFYTGDNHGTFLIWVEGITADGRTVSGTKSFTIGQE